MVTDAGFRAPWLRALVKFGWFYVGRLRGRTRIEVVGAVWFDNRELRGKVRCNARRLQDVRMVESDPWRVDLVLYRKPRQGRVRRSGRKGTRSQANASTKAQRRESEPWLLVVSPELRHLQPRQLVAIYAKRKQIEQSFRDLKCDRLGCAFNYSLARDPKRIAILLLIHALATFVAWLAALSISVNAQVRYGGVKSSRPRLHYSQCVSVGKRCGAMMRLATALHCRRCSIILRPHAARCWRFQHEFVGKPQDLSPFLVPGGSPLSLH